MQVSLTKFSLIYIKFSLREGNKQLSLMKDCYSTWAFYLTSLKLWYVTMCCVVTESRVHGGRWVVHEHERPILSSLSGSSSHGGRWECIDAYVSSVSLPPPLTDHGPPCSSSHLLPNISCSRLNSHSSGPHLKAHTHDGSNHRYLLWY